MSNSGDDQPLAPRRSLHKTPTSVDAPTEPVLTPSYPAGPDPHQSAPSAPAPGSAPSPAGAPVGFVPPGGAPGGQGSTAQPSSPSWSSGGSTAAVQSSAGQPAQPSSPYDATPDRRPEQTQPQPAPSRAGRTRTVRRARLRVVRVDPWSITKIAFLLSIAFGIMCVVAVFLVVSVMTASGLWDNVNDSIQGVLNQQPDEAFDITDWVSMDKVLGLTMLIAVLNVVLMTALATLGAFLYNLSSSLLGGVEVTLAEDQK